MHLHPRLHRLQLFRQLVWQRDRSGKRMSVKQAWRVAGIASGQMEAIPDSVLSWWWKIQDLRPNAEEDNLQAKGDKAQTHRQQS